MEEIVIKELVQPEPEVIKIPKVSKLDRLRKIIPKQFPQVKFKEDLDFIAKFRRNLRCETCNRYFLQSRISDIKAKIRRDKGTDLTPFMIRIYKNSAEKLEDAKGYCRLVVSQGRDTKTMITCPHMSLCSNYSLHTDIKAYFRLVSQELNAKAELERKAREEINRDLERKAQAEKLVVEITEKYKKKPGRPSKNELTSPKENGDNSV